MVPAPELLEDEELLLDEDEELEDELLLEEDELPPVPLEIWTTQSGEPLALLPGWVIVTLAPEAPETLPERYVPLDGSYQRSV